LITLRKTIPSLHSRFWAPITPDPVPQTVFGYIRYGEASEAPVIVLLNFSEEPAEFKFDIPEQFSALSGEGSLYDVLHEESVPALEDGRMHISVPASTARVLTVLSTS
jgi:hypothetical protein